ncbi:MAG: hypothetical protein ABEK50_14945 [bacterium]
MNQSNKKEDTAEDVLPVDRRESHLETLIDWIREEPTSLAALRYPPAEEDEPQTHGVFRSLPPVNLFVLELESGERAGHEYHYRGERWRVHVQWDSWQYMAKKIRKRSDESNLRKAILEGQVVFDDPGVFEFMQKNAKRTEVYDMIDSRERMKLRARLTDFLDEINQFFSGIDELDSRVTESLMQKYHELVEIVKTITGSDAKLLDISHLITRAGESRHHLSKCIRELHAIGKEMLGIVGGRAPVEWYAPTYMSHLMPPNPDRPEGFEPEEEVDTCPRCFRRFLENDDPTEPGTERVEVAPPPDV